MLIRDQAGRTARLLLYSGIGWLCVAAAAGAGAALAAGGFVPAAAGGGAPWAFVRLLQPVFLNALVFGWAAMAGVGVALLVMHRTHGTALHSEPLGQLAVWVWNAANGAGIAGLGLGLRAGGPLAEYIWPAKLAWFLGLLLVLYNVARTLSRTRQPLYVSDWYLLAALAWTAVVYPLGTGLWLPEGLGSGPMGALLYGMYTQGIVWLWAVPLALGAALYVAPSIAGHPLYSGKLAQLGLWGLALYAGTGIQRLWGASLPGWVQALPAALGALTLVPALAAAANLHHTVRPRWAALAGTPAGRFLQLGSGLLVLAAVQAAIEPLGIVQSRIHATQWAAAAPLTALLGGATFLLFAGVYELLPMLRRPADRLQAPLYGPRAARWHAGASSLGVVLFVAGLWLGGTLQAVQRAAFSPAALQPALALQAAGLALFLVAQVFLVYTVARAAVAPREVQLPVTITYP